MVLTVMIHAVLPVLILLPNGKTSRVIQIMTVMVITAVLLNKFVRVVPYHQVTAQLQALTAMIHVLRASRDQPRLP